MNSNQKALAVRLALALAALTIFCYVPLASSKFINVDDPVYIVKNAQVNQGLTGSGVLWAFQTSHACNWHPLTWISHMLDCSLFGLNPAGHHLMSLSIHVANVLLLFVLLFKMTGAMWRSALVAAFFALHPLRVESIAWASERKDVLSTLFFLLTLLAYLKYCKGRDAFRAVPDSAGTSQAPTPRKLWYRLSLAFFALGLMCKPMLVTLPFVLLLLDFWPLGRFSENWNLPAERLPSVVRLTAEKLPFLLLSVVSSVVTYLAQHAGGAVSNLNGVPLSLRLGNMFISYWRYIAKTLWPAHLVSIYPLPAHISLFATAAAALALGTVCALSLRARKTQPYLITGWFWYLGTLVPTIGLVQVGAQAIADRYTYIPSIGLFVIGIWGATDLISAWRRANSSRLNSSGLIETPSTFAPHFGIAALVSLLLAGCVACTWVQVRYWRDGETLHRHTLKVDPQNYVAYEQLGTALAESGKTEEAIQSLKESVRLSPNYPEAQYNLGTMYLEQDSFQDALAHLETAVKLNPNDPNAHHNLGNVYVHLKQYPQATTELAIAATLKPGDAPVRLALANVLLAQDRFGDAAILFFEVARLAPDNIEAHRNLGVAFARQGKFNEASEQFAIAVKMDPKTPELRSNLGLALFQGGRVQEAAAQFAEVLRLRPNDSNAHFRLARCLAQQQSRTEAITHLREAVRLTPNFPEALLEIASILATAPEPALRNPQAALEFAQRAREQASAGGQVEVARAAESFLKRSEAQLVSGQ